MRTRELVWGLGLALTLGGAAFADPQPQPPLGPQTAPMPRADVTKEQAKAAVAELERLVAAHYFFPEKRQTIVDALKKADAAGRYDTTNPLELCDRVTEDLQAAAHDGHLRLMFQPPVYADLTRPPGGRHDAGSFQRADSRRHNDGYEELRVLPGNIRYVKITGFHWEKDTTPRIVDDAVRFLSGGDAIIVDLRGNGGGDAEAVQRLVSYFFPAKTDRELMSFYDGITGETGVNKTLTNLPSPRLAGIPYYLLTDDRTASAAEELTYHTQQFKLGTIVGRTTAGGANNNNLYPIAPGFVASVSVGRPIHPVSKSNWEGVGIKPDVDVPAETALDQAQILALQSLAKNATAENRASYDWAIAGLNARLKPVTLAPKDMQAYVGVYGIRKVWIEGGALRFQREGRPQLTLVPMGNDLFGFAETPQIRVQFRRKDGKVVGFDQLTDDGRMIPAERTA